MSAVWSQATSDKVTVWQANMDAVKWQIQIILLNDSSDFLYRFYRPPPKYFFGIHLYPDIFDISSNVYHSI